MQTRSKANVLNTSRLAYDFAVIGCTFGWPATYISFHHVQAVFPGEIRLFPSFQSDHQHKQPFRLIKQFSRIDPESRNHGFAGNFHNFGTIEGCWVLGRWDCYMLCSHDEHPLLCWLKLPCTLETQPRPDTMFEGATWRWVETLGQVP